MDKMLCSVEGIALFAILLAVSKRPNQISDKIFAVFMGSIVYPGVVNSIPYNFSFFSHLFVPIINFLPLSLGPFMYIYTNSLIYENFRINKQILLHFIPVLLFSIIGVCLPNHTSMAGISYMDNGVKLVGMIGPLALMLSFLLYSIFIQIRLKNHRKKILDCFTHTPTRITLTWLTWLVLIFFNLFILTHIPVLLNTQNLIQLNPSFWFWSDSVHNTGIFLFMLSLSFFGVRQQNVFARSESAGPEKDSVGEKQQGKYETSKLKEKQLQGYLTRLENYMVSEKPYLDGDLTLAGLAEDLNLPKHHLTETINRKLKKNFFTYINGYRVIEVKQLLLNPKNANKTILEIALLAGFNSKSSFNTFFKKATQISPSEFRKKHMP